MKIMRPTLLITLILVSVFAWSTVPALATVYYLENPSFEDLVLPDNSWINRNIPGWTIHLGTGNCGTWNPTDGRFSSGIPHGDNISYVYRGAISQNVKNIDHTVATLTPNHLYHLSAYVASYASDYPPQYSVELWAGNFLLATAEPATFTETNTFMPVSLEYLAPPDFAGLNQPLIVRLVSMGKMGFDNVAVSNLLVPLPPSVLLLGTGLVGLVLWRRQK